MDINFSTIRWSNYASNVFSTLHTQKFDMAIACQQVAKQFAEKIKTFKDIDAKAIA